MIAIEPRCTGDCEIALDFDGGTETKTTYVFSGLALLALSGCLLFGRRIPVTGAECGMD